MHTRCWMWMERFDDKHLEMCQWWSVIIRIKVGIKIVVRNAKSIFSFQFLSWWSWSEGQARHKVGIKIICSVCLDFEHGLCRLRDMSHERRTTEQTSQHKTRRFLECASNHRKCQSKWCSTVEWKYECCHGSSKSQLLSVSLWFRGRSNETFEKI